MLRSDRIAGFAAFVAAAAMIVTVAQAAVTATTPAAYGAQTKASRLQHTPDTLVGASLVLDPFNKNGIGSVVLQNRSGHPLKGVLLSAIYSKQLKPTGSNPDGMLDRQRVTWFLPKFRDKQSFYATVGFDLKSNTGVAEVILEVVAGGKHYTRKACFRISPQSGGNLPETPCRS